jgi:hypothetical protein
MTNRIKLALAQGYLRLHKMTFTLDWPVAYPIEAEEGIRAEFQAISGEMLAMGYEWRGK